MVKNTSVQGHMINSINIVALTHRFLHRQRPPSLTPDANLVMLFLSRPEPWQKPLGSEKSFKKIYTILKDNSSKAGKGPFKSQSSNRSLYVFSLQFLNKRTLSVLQLFLAASGVSQLLV